MKNDLGSTKWLGPFASPVAITISLLTLAITFQSYAETFGWKLVSLVFLGVSSAWAAWYLAARVIKESELEGVNVRKVPRHQNRMLRLGAPLFPVLACVLCALAFLQPKERDYSGLLQGGGPLSPIVVFDSEPQGADVKVAWILHAESDPWLERDDDEKILHVGQTLTRARFGNGHYWAVFELDCQRLQKGFTVSGPTVVTVEF